MSLIEFKTDKLVPCQCGFKPDHYTVAYGRTPYDIFCPTCKKQTAMARCLITNSPDNLIDYWNRHVAKLTKEQMEQEVKALKEERKREDPYHEFSSYDYYWWDGQGEELIKKHSGRM